MLNKLNDEEVTFVQKLIIALLAKTGSNPFPNNILRSILKVSGVVNIYLFYFKIELLSSNIHKETKISALLN